MKRKLQTYIGEIIEPMVTGEIKEIPLYGNAIGRVRISAKQAAGRRNITLQLRTIEGKLYARRTDFPTPPATMPGLVPKRSTVSRVIATLESMRPWSDDPNADRINEALDMADFVFKSSSTGVTQ